MLHILIADDHGIVRSGLRMLSDYLADNATAPGRAENRRVSMKVTANPNDVPIESR